MPTQRYGAGGDGSYELSDIDDKMEDRESENDYDGDLVISEERGDYLYDNSNGYTKGLEEIEELVKVALFEDNIDNVETQSKVKDDKNTTPTRKE